MSAITIEKRKKRINYIRDNWELKSLKQMAKEECVNIDCIAQWGKKLKLKKYKNKQL